MFSPQNISVNSVCALIKVLSKQQLNTKSFVQYSCVDKVGLMHFGFSAEHSNIV